MNNSFDITKHNWSDDDVYIDISSRSITIDGSINKDDAIAIARHFNLIDSAILHGKRISNKLANYEEEFIKQEAFKNTAAKGVLRSGKEQNELQKVFNSCFGEGND